MEDYDIYCWCILAAAAGKAKVHWLSIKVDSLNFRALWKQISTEMFTATLTYFSDPWLEGLEGLEGLWRSVSERLGARDGSTVGLGGTLGCVYVVSGMHHILPCKAVILHPGHHLTADVEHNTADVACRIL